MTLQSEAKYKLSVLEVEVANQEVNRVGALLNISANYWEQFINKDGKTVNKKALLEAGYDGDGQVDWIAQEMAERGWLGGKATEKPGTVDAALAKSAAKRKAREAAKDADDAALD